MTQEQILQRVKEGLGQTSVSDRTINDFISIFPVAEGTEPSDAYFEQITKACKTVNGNISAVTAQAVNTAKSDWENAHSSQQNQQNVQQSNADYDALKKEFEELKNRINEREVKITETQLRENVKKKSKDLKVDYENLWNDLVSSTPVGENVTEAEFLKMVKDSYVAKVQSYYGAGTAPFKSTSTPEESHTKAQKELDDYFKKKFGIKD